MNLNFRRTGFASLAGILVACFSILPLQADPQKTDLSTQKVSNQAPEKQVPPVMFEFLGEMIRLQPFMISEEKFRDPKNQDEILPHLANLKSLSKRLNHSERLNTSSFQITASSIQEHLTRTQEAFVAGRKDYARRLLNATLSGCGSCHTQVPSQKVQWKFKPDELKGNHFEKAEFLFAVRHYQEALESYDAFLKSASKNSGRNMQMATALHRKLAIFVRIFNNPEQAMASFEMDLKNPNIQSRHKEEIKAWISSLKGLMSSRVPNTATAKISEIEAYAEKALQPLLEKGMQFEPKHFVTFLHISGLLYQSINTRPSTELTPGALYWLAVCDIRLNESYFFSFAELYLKECISRFPASDKALACYNELESSTALAFTGSGGVQIPEDVQKDLKKYKDMIRTKL